MNTIGDGDQQIPLNSGEWLSLGRNPTHRFSDSELQARPKIFSCNYCMRKFYSSQALGGHQNAHKRERGAIRQYQSQRMMTMMAPPMNTSMMRSLGVRQHSLAPKPGRDGGAPIARFYETGTEFGNPWQTNPMEEAMDPIWPGSFRLDQQQQKPDPQPANPTNLDLNLKL